MSFLTQILNTTETVEMNEIQAKIPEITLQVEKTKSEVTKYIDNVYVKFHNRPKLHHSLLNNAKQIKGEVERLKQNANEVCEKDIVKANTEFENHKIELEKKNLACKIIQSIIEFNVCLNQIRYLEEIQSYLECIKLIRNLQLSLEEVPEDECVDAILALKDNVSFEKSELLNLLDNHFNDNIVLLNETDVFTITFKKENPEMLEVLRALYFNDSEAKCLVALTNYMWYNIFTNIVNCKTDVEIVENETTSSIALHIKSRTDSDSYIAVFNNLQTILEFIKCKCSYKFDDTTVLDYVGRNTRDNLSELLIKNCLQATIPSSAEDLIKYKVVIEDTEKLEIFLKDCGIFAADTTSILEYVSNVDVLFITKKCNEYCQLSETIMKKDLHDKVEVGTPFDNNNPFSDTNITTFSQCCISKSTLELMELAEKILHQVIQSSGTAADRLLGTVKNIFQKYVNVVPTFHQKLLQTIPQQVALFHNNCIYMANQLSKWDEKYSSQLPVTEGSNIFQKEICELEEIGSLTFSNCVDNQINQINEIMKDAGLNVQSLEKLEPVTEKSVRQCIRQQELLKNVWHNILSYNVYNGTIGLILDSLCVILIDAIVKFEDISSDMAEQLVDILKIIATRGPKLFTDSREINLFVPSWNKFNDVNFVLGASLLDIDNRWADGMGPLGLHFAPSELKQMIRALFQNTERRANLLAKIQNKMDR